MSSGKQLFATVSIKANCKNCFIELSDCLAKQCHNHFSNDLPDVICVQNDKGSRSYVSWIPRRQSGNLPTKQVIYIGKAFADCIGLKDNELVFLHPVLNVSPCQKVSVAPVNPDEWEILDLNSQLIEQTMLEQIRLVHPDLRFPLFLKGSAVVVLMIESTTPELDAGFLEEFTELHIAPKLSRSLLPENNKENYGKNVNKPRFKSLYGLDKEKTRSRKFNNFDTFLTNFFGLKRIEGLETRESHVSELIPEREDYDAAVNPGRNHFIDVLRINLTSANSHRTNDGCLRDATLPPFCLCISEEYFKSSVRSCECASNGTKRKIIMMVSKSLSPKEIDENKRRKKKASDGVTLISKQERVAFVELSREERTDETLFDQSKWASVSSELMAYLDAGQGTLLDITCAHDDPLKLSSIVINVIDIKVASLDEGDVRSMFQNWIRGKLDAAEDGMLVNNSMAINMEDTEGGNVFATIDFQSSAEQDTSKEHYFLISYHSLENVAVTVKFHTSEVKNTSYESLQKRLVTRKSFSSNLGGVADSIARGKSFLDELFTHHSIDTGASVSRRKSCLLICGSSRTAASGCGRTSLCKALCDYYQNSPNFCHIEFVDCIPLRGKKPETILHRFSVAMEEARWRQPSIIVFDDLDSLIKQPDPVKDAEPTIVYHSRLAEGLKDILRQAIISDDSIATILLSKTRDALHDIFSAPSGWHFIGCSIVIRPPNEQAREEIMRALLKRMSCKVTENSELRKFAASTEGYLPTDLGMVLKRAKNSAMTRNPEEDAAGFQIVTEKDFEAAVLGYKPVGLHGIELHKPGNLGWENVGGLAEAKRVLKETFVWPMQYKSLFAKCPFRMRSGVLLYGPSGTGKTLLAGVVAKECGMKFVSIKGPELLSKYVGSSEQNVRDLFARAQSASPCILFFDEFDALAPKRGHDNTGVTDRVVNQLLTQLDGVEKLENVFILAATSRPDLIDPALLRPGRLDKCVYCPMPDENDRQEILNSLSIHLELDEGIDWGIISQKTIDFSGADLKALLYNAQLRVMHKKVPVVSDEALKRRETGIVPVEESSLKISDADVMEALNDTSPSVSVSEVKQFQARFQNFIASRRGQAQPTDAGIRVTLA